MIPTPPTPPKTIKNNNQPLPWVTFPYFKITKTKTSFYFLFIQMTHVSHFSLFLFFWPKLVSILKKGKKRNDNRTHLWLHYHFKREKNGEDYKIFSFCYQENEHKKIKNESCNIIQGALCQKKSNLTNI